MADAPLLPTYEQLHATGEAATEPRPLSPYAKQQLNERLIPEAKEVLADAREAVKEARAAVSLVQQTIIDARANGVHIAGKVGPLPVVGTVPFEFTAKVANL